MKIRIHTTTLITSLRMTTSLFRHSLGLFFLASLLILPVTSSLADDRIPMTLDRQGIYTIPCEVNGLKLNFIFDTGAADVHLSLIEAAFMYKNGYITDEDFIGTGKYSMADGSISENSMVNLKTIKIGNTVIHNVTACISSKITASLLLGQSAIRKLGDYSIQGTCLVLNGDNSSRWDLTQASSSTNSYRRNGALYEGNVVNGLLEGQGKVSWDDGTIYVGNFVDGVCSGKGKVTWKDGSYYEGEYIDGLRNGSGTYVWANGNKYTGNWVNNKREGQGTMTYSDGEYTGQWENDKRNGYGYQTLKNGNSYLGYFVDDLYDGQGTYSWANSNKYVGNFSKGIRTGKGTFYYADGSIYEGDFSNNDFNGKGILTFSPNSKTGSKSYAGDFVNGKQEGYGTFLWTNGDYYNGYWKGGEFNGNGTYHYADGTMKSGTWKAGQFLGSSGSTTSYSYRNKNSSTGDVSYFTAITTADINLYDSPSSYYGKVIASVPKGSVVFLTSQDSGESYRKVIYVDKDEIGYLSSYCLTDFEPVSIDSKGNLQIDSRNYKSTADVEIENRTDKYTTIKFGSKSYKFSPHETRTIYDVKPGRYNIIASAPGVTPYVGYDKVESGYKYSWVFYIKTVYK